MAITSQESRRILVVDHDPSVVQMLRVSLRQAGFNVLTASALKEAFETATACSPDLIVLGAFQSDVSRMQLREQLWQTNATKDIPILLLVDKVDEEISQSLLGGAFNYITKPFDPSEVVAYVKSYLPDLPYRMDVNQLTELPGPRWIEHELLVRMIQQKTFALINVDINHLRPFRRVYGVPRADHAIKLLGRIISEAVRLFGNDGDFVGHLGEDDFYVITSPDRYQALCQRIISSFDDRIKDLYTREDVVKGYMESEYPQGYLTHQPLMTVSIGVTTSENRGATDPLAMRRVASEMREFAKLDQRSSFRSDKRSNDLTLEATLGSVGRQNALSAFGRRSTQPQRDKADFSQLVISQLRIPVTIVQSTLDYLVQSGQMNLSSEQRQHLDVLKKHARHLSDIISQLTNFYKNCQSDWQTHLETVDLAPLIDQIVGFVKEIAVGKNINLEVRGAENIRQIVVDVQKLGQAILYTLYSIVEYSPQRQNIRIDVSETESHVRIAIVVDELSLTREELARAFRSFYRPQKVTVPNHGSIGLGFYLARQLLHSIDGTMTVRRREKFCIGFDFPKVWQSVEERAKVIQREVSAARTIAEMEMGRVEALLTNQNEAPTALRTIFNSVGSLIEQMALDANRAISLAEETTRRLSDEHERMVALDVSFISFLEVLIDLIERRDRYFTGHSRRVAAEAFAIGRDLRLPEDELNALYYAALLHDIGMVAISDQILSKTTALSDDEISILQQHSTIGARSVSAAKGLCSLVQPILHHHERYDGKGYPMGLKGERIPIAARVLALADAYDSMISTRPYRSPISPRLAIEKISEGVGTQFDPKVVAVFLKLHVNGGLMRA